MQELMQEGTDLSDVLDILENGYESPRKRKRGTVEKWLNRGNKTYNAVIVKDYYETNKEEVWLLIHFGKFTTKRK
ncbi:MAG: hypothetical protein ABIE94_06645 [archaeon]